MPLKTKVHTMLIQRKDFFPPLRADGENLSRPRRGIFSGAGGRMPTIRPPTRINGKIGYPMGPTRPPKWFKPNPEPKPLPLRELHTPSPPPAQMQPPSPGSPWGSPPDDYLDDFAVTSPAGTGPGARRDSSSSSGSSSSRNSSTSGDYDRSPPHEVENPPANLTLAKGDIPAGGRLNRLGLIERSDLPKVYRVEKKARVDRRCDPTQVGFLPSTRFGGVPKMIDGDAIIASRTRAAATYFGDTEFGRGEYRLYEIDTEGVPTVSLRENIDHNTAFAATAYGGISPESVAHMRAAGDTSGMNEIDEGGYGFDEVHIPADNHGAVRLIS